MLTTRVKAAARDSAPDVPLTAIVYVPTGVKLVVLMVSTDCPPAGTEPGENEHFACAGSPPHANATLPGKLPPRELTVTVTFTFLPLATLALVGDTATAKSSPTPLKATTLGLPAALESTVRLAVLCPAALGVNVTAIAQLVPGATLAAQLLLCV